MVEVDRMILSIIIPVYNSEKYISECLDSIVNCKLTDYEVIVVDDGSSDKSAVICDDYSSRYPIIKTFHRKNSGVSASRNFGIAKASGRYVMFVDSDDYIDSEVLYQMVSIVKSNGEIDCVISGLNYYYEVSNVVRSYPIWDNEFDFSKEKEINENFMRLRKGMAFYAVYSKLYRLDLLKSENIRFDENYSILEDSAFTLEYLSKTKWCVTINNILYFYRQTENDSLVKKYNVNALDAVRNRYRKFFPILKALDDDNANVFLNEYFCETDKYINDLYYRGNECLKSKYTKIQKHLLSYENCTLTKKARQLTSKHHSFIRLFTEHKMTKSLHMYMTIKSKIREILRHG